MPNSRRIPVSSAPMRMAGLCPLCWKRADKRDRTNNGYHIECAKEAVDILTDLMHSKRGIVYTEWYRKRYPGRPVPGVPVAKPARAKGD